MIMMRVKMLMKNKKKIIKRMSQKKFKKKDKMAVINSECTKITLNF